ncbi:hypothetical protein ACFORL_05585 [Legionella dresdenensis]|uniref:Uncharacterized protein n=1 Tax=Legionella dresdenensis TaxID=450200 RepID=A0ABV8CEG1_9GAMM
MNFKCDKETILKFMVQRLTNIVASLLEIIKQKDEQLKIKYRLVDWVEKNGTGYCRIQLVGTSVVNDYTPEEIVADDDFISGFSHFDIRTVTNLANHEKYKPKAKIMFVKHEENCVGIKENGQIQDINIDNGIQSDIKKFSQNDAFILGRLLGENDIKI